MGRKHGRGSFVFSIVPARLTSDTWRMTLEINGATFPEPHLPRSTMLSQDWWGSLGRAVATHSISGPSTAGFAVAVISLLLSLRQNFTSSEANCPRLKSSPTLAHPSGLLAFPRHGEQSSRIMFEFVSPRRHGACVPPSCAVCAGRENDRLYILYTCH